jgi:hypothetical protein
VPAGGPNESAHRAGVIIAAPDDLNPQITFYLHEAETPPTMPEPSPRRDQARVDWTPLPDEMSTRDLRVDDLAEVAEVVVVPIADAHRGTLRALNYARRLSIDVRAVIVITDAVQRERILRRWARFPEITGSRTSSGSGSAHIRTSS